MSYKDGNFTIATQCGPIHKWLDSNTRSILYRQSMMQFAANWVSSPRGMSGEYGSYLVDESEPTEMGPVYKWDRIFAYVPDDRDEPESYVHPYQFIQSGELGEIALPVKSRIAYKYYHTTSIDSIPLLRAYRALKIGTVIYISGTPVGVSDEIIAEDSKITRWKGNIFERATRYVPHFTISALG